jgi:hypothetical protein
MTDDDALPPDMRRLLASLGSTPPVLDEDTADRLLTGRLDPSDAPPGYAGVARVLASATAPTAPDELAGEAAAVAEFTAAAQSSPPTPLPRRSDVARRPFSIKVAVAVIAAVLSIGGVAAAATGLLPQPAQWVADEAPSTARGASAAGEHGSATGPDAAAAAKQGLCRAWLADQAADNGKRDDSIASQALATAAGGADKVAAYCHDVATGSAGEHGSATGPDAAAAAKEGLCRAWLAGQGGDNGKRDDSIAFQALATAAGGADKVAAYCHDVATADPGAHSNGSSATATTRPAPPSSGPPATTGHGPPTTSG